MLIWQVTLDVGFGRRLHIPQQQSSRQTPPADSGDTEPTLPAAFFTFEQVLGFCMAMGQPAGAWHLHLILCCLLHITNLTWTPHCNHMIENHLPTPEV